MHVVISLLGVALLYCFCAYMSYHESWHGQWWYVPLGVLTGAAASGVWFAMAAYLKDRQAIYLYNFYWDVVLCSVFYLVPVLCCGVKLNWAGVLGLAMMAAGTLLLKVQS